MAAKFLYCKHCKNLIGMVNDSGVVPVCCGDPMTELKANTEEASHEKHLPVVTVESTDDGMRLIVDVGSAAHPMTAAHLIEWIFVETDKGGHRQALKADDAPKAKFLIPEGEMPVAVYAYCNLHGLWKTAL